MLSNNKNATKNYFFWILAVFSQKQQKIIWQNPNRLMKFSEIWYVDASHQRKMLQKLFLDFGIFWPFFNQKQPKLTKNEENWQNSNRSMKFSEIWYVDASQQTKKLQKTFFWILAFFGRFFNKKMAKIEQK